MAESVAPDIDAIIDAEIERQDRETVAPMRAPAADFNFDFDKEIARQDNEDLTLRIERPRTLAVSTTRGGPRVKLPGGPTASPFEDLDAGPSRSLLDIGRTIGRTMGLAGTGVAAIGSDIIEAPAQAAGRQEPFRNIKALGKTKSVGDVLGGLEPFPTTPFEEETAQTRGLERFLRIAATSLAKTEPQLAAGFGLGALGAPAEASAALPMLVTPEGEYDPIGATIALGLPGVTHLGERAVALSLGKAPVTKVMLDVLSKDPLKLKGKVVQNIGGVEVSNDQFRKFLEAGGGFLAANAYLLATHAPQIAELPKEQRAQAIIDSVASAIAPSLLGFIRPGMSQTLQEKAPEIAPELAKVVQEIKQQTKGGQRAPDTEQQQGGVQPERPRTDEVGKTPAGTSPRNRLPGAAGQPPQEPAAPPVTPPPPPSAPAPADTEVVTDLGDGRFQSTAPPPPGAFNVTQVTVNGKTTYTWRLPDKLPTPGLGGQTAVPPVVHPEAPPVPERPETIAAQLEMLKQGKRPAVMITTGEKMPSIPTGMETVKTSQGDFIFDPKRITAKDIRTAVDQDAIGDVLSYGISRKPAPGTEVGAVVVRSPEGVEKWAALTDEAHLPSVMRAARAVADPGDKVNLEPEAQVIAWRQHGATSTGVTEPNPTPEQIEAGNAPKRKVKVHGLEISIENEQGSVRRSKPGFEPAWEVTMPAAYGYIKGTKDRTGEQVDAYLGPTPSSKAVFIIDQIDPETGKYDEPKVLLGFKSSAEALATYAASFSDGKGQQRIGAITGMTVDQFKAWLKSDGVNKPVGKLRPVKVNWKQIGKNADGNPVFEDDRGVRSVTENGIRTTEPVVINPDGSIGTSDRKGTEFETVESAPRLTYEEFSQQYRDAFANANKYGPNEVGSQVFTEKMASLADTYPEFLKRLEAEEQDNEKPTTPQQQGTAPDKTPETPAPTPTAGAETQGAIPAAISPVQSIANFVQGKLNKGEAFTSKQLFEAADVAYGKSQAQGGYTPKDAYDAMEAGINLYIAAHPKEFAPDGSWKWATDTVTELKRLIGLLPTQTARTKESDQMQQFSTPPPLAYVANWVANIKPGDVMLEPSAGIGGIAVFAKNGGAIVIANELSPRRFDVLRQTAIANKLLSMNAEQLHALLEPAIQRGEIERPTVVVMNPPFSNAAKSGKSGVTMVGAQHVEEALKTLAPGGRLVAIVGEGMAMGKPTFVPWWRKIGQTYNIRANIGISGDEYKKYGTSFGNQILVIDKTGPTKDLGKVVTGQVQKIEELIPLLEAIRNERESSAPVGATQPAPPEPSGPAAAPEGGGSGESGASAPVTPGAGKPAGGKRPAGTRPGSLRPKPGSAAPSAKPADQGSGTGGRAEPAPAETAGSAPPDAEQAAAQGLTLEQVKDGRRKLAEVGVFSEYHPSKVKIAGAKPHPTPLVESTAMAAVQPPDPTHKPKLPKEIITSGALSDAQLENVVYAGQAHTKDLPSGERLGYFVGDGCVAAGTRIYNPITKKHTKIEDLCGKQHWVLSLTKDGLSPCLAVVTFLKGTARLYKVTLDDGRTITVTGQHRFLSPSGWTKIDEGLRVGCFLGCAEGHPAKSLGFGQSVHVADDPHCLRTVEDCLENCFDAAGGSCGEQLPSGRGSDRSVSPSQVGARGHSQLLLQTDGREISEAHNRRHRSSCHRAKNNFSPSASRDLFLIANQTRASFALSLASILQKTSLFRRGSVWPHSQSEPTHPSEPARTMPCSSQSFADGGLQFVAVKGSAASASSLDDCTGWRRITSIEFVGEDLFYDMYVPGPENYVAEGVINHNTGVGKGREIAAIIMDNWNSGRKKHVWVSKTGNLINDAGRDLSAIGFDKTKLIDMSKGQGKALEGAKDGVAFVTYTSLAKNNPGINAESLQEKKPKPNPVGEGKKKSRIHQLYDWLGPDFDGVIAFDETHLAGNAVDIKGTRGVKKASDRGKTVVDVQKLFPRARILYVSATGATDVTNLSYADRLGIWGHGTAFPNKGAFFDEIRAGGLSAMEIVARDLKSMGRYMARTLSFEGVEQVQLPHKLTPEQKDIYNEAAKAWQLVFAEVDNTMAHTGANQNGKARGAALSALYGAEQRFFNTLLTAMQMPTVIGDMRKKLESGGSILLQIVNTNEATLGRELAEKATEGEMDLENLDLSPKDTILQYVDNCYPTTKYEEVQDDQGNTSWQPVRDAQGNPVDDPEAVAAKQALLDKLALLKMPQNPLEMILDTFGAKNVAEVTGRSRRVVQREQPDGTLKRVLETNRGESQRKVEDQEFQDGKRRILIFSDAGGTGFSYHASRKEKNQQRRYHYLIQAGWKADQAIQGMGRSHRSDQATAPFYMLAHTDIMGHQRFISTIARRLAELGALTTGERKSTGQGLFEETNNLENSYAEDSVTRLFMDLHAGNVEGFNFDDLTARLGYVKTLMDPHTGEVERINLLKDPMTGALYVDKIPSIQQFLNRILALEFEEQNNLFDQFMDRMKTRIENAKADGSYDPGTQTLKALSIRKLTDEVVYEHPESTAKTRIAEVEHQQPVEPNEWEDIKKIVPREPLIGFVKNLRSGLVYAIKEGPPRTLESGAVVPTYRMIGPSSVFIKPRKDVSQDNYQIIAQQGEEDWKQKLEVAEELWNQQIAKLPKVHTKRDSYVVGAFLPIWDRLKLSSPKIWRITTDDGEVFLGAHVPSDAVGSLRARLGAGQGAEITGEQAFDDILGNNRTIQLSNGWTLKRSLRSGEQRIEVLGIEYNQMREFTDFIGGFMERIQFQPRFFVPTERAAGIAAMEKILKKAPPIADAPQASLAAEPEEPNLTPSGLAPYEARSVEELRALLPHIGLSQEHQDLLAAFLDSPLGKMLEGIRVRVADTLDGGWQGSFFQKLVEIARNSDPLTGPHEFLHHIWDLLPDDLKQELERMRVASLDLMITEAKAAGKPETVKALEDLRDNPTAGGEEFLARGYPAALQGSMYPFSSTEEFFTHSASARFKQRVGSMKDGFWQAIKDFVRQFIDAIKKALRLKRNQDDFLDSILRGDFEPAKAEEIVAKEKQGSLTPEEQAEEMQRMLDEAAEQHRIPTVVLGEPYYVNAREQLDPAIGHAVAKRLLDTAGLPATEQIVTRDGQSYPVWVMTPQGRDMTREGEALLKAYQAEVAASPPGKARPELGAIINAIRQNFEWPATKSAMAEMQPWIRVELWAAAQSDASARGLALRALMGLRDDVITIGRNIDAELGKIWSQATGGDALRRVLDDLNAAQAEIERLKAEGKGLGPGAGPGTGTPDQTAEIERLKKALDEALKKHAKGMRKRWGPGTKLGRQFIDLVRAGNGKPWEALKALVASQGWKIPTDEQLAQAKRWADKLAALGALTEAEKAGKTTEQQEEALRIKMAATADEQLRLRKEIETLWQRLSKPYSIRTRAGRENITSSIGDWVSANLLAKIGFATRQAIDVGTQMATYTPTSAIAHALLLHEQEIADGKRNRSDVGLIWRDVSKSLTAAYKARAKALRAALDAAGAVVTGANQGRNVAQLMGRVSIYDKAMQRADELDARGEHTKAWLLKFFTLHKFGYMVSQALDQFQGVPLVYQEMRQQVVRALRDNGMNAAEAEAQAGYVIGEPRRDAQTARAEAELYLRGNGIEVTEQALSHAAYRIALARAYERMRALGLEADDFENRNLFMLEANAWNVREEGGIGGFAADVMRRGARAGRQISGAGITGLPFGIALTTMTRFGNAIGITLNRKLTWTGLGFFPGWFGVDEREIGEDGVARGGSAFYRYPEQRKQRKVEAAIGLSGQIALFLLVAGGAIIVRLAWPKDKEERQVWDRNGWKPGQVDIPTGDGSHIRFSLNVGPMAMFSPGLSAGAALHDLGAREQKQQDKLNAEAERLGLQPGKIRGRNLGDYLGVVANAAWRAITSGRTISGLLSSFSEQGDLHVAKSVSSVASALSPYQPGLQEVLRMMNGTVLNTRTASVWDFFMPLPGSGSAQVNFLGDPVGSANGVQRMVEILTGGNNLVPINDKARETASAYQAVFSSGWRPPSIDPNKAYQIGDQYRPMTDSELRKYAVARGQNLKAELSGIGPEPSQSEMRAAYRRANEAALDGVGVTAPQRAAGTRQIRAESAPGQAGSRGTTIRAPRAGGGLGRARAFSPRVPGLSARRTLAPRRPRLARTRQRGLLRVGRGLRLRSRLRSPRLRLGRYG